jgi:hypothetical protein
MELEHSIVGRGSTVLYFRVLGGGALLLLLLGTVRVWYDMAWHNFSSEMRYIFG